MYLSEIKAAPAETTAISASPLRSRPRKAIYLALPLAGLLIFGYRALEPSNEARADASPIPAVTVSQPLEREIVEWDDYVGRFEASQAVEIRPRVSGALQSIHFKDGDTVRKGQLLFVIDPRPFTAALAEARAREASAATALALARSELARANRLIADEAVSAEEVDSLRAAVRSAEAALNAARAQVRSRALDVEFTQVRAPITGRVSDRRVDIGNLVAGDSAGSATLLTTVYALDPIYFSFDGSEALYLKQRRQKQADQEVQIRLQDETGYRWKGKVDFTDNALDTGSGTIRGRAVLANPDYFLTPGMFGNMRLAAGGEHRALLVPDAAVQTDQVRKIVYVVQGGDDVVVAKPVEIGPLVNGLRVIRQGIAPGDRVVIQGVQYAQPGARVTPRPGKISEVPTAVASTSFTPPTASQATIKLR
ncbi:efflux RND transporter periplasmic adaptor subunit [Rhizorhapis suberifaciens]|uniref:RND family efflux transporter MFP subunit n=1 Tax=Rhizorhapis suberifaciens TaxID=13656 RepID=A0A840HZM5_9SPHN|nr:efflux RND transporter periplasmic adaptor subunit [Rhizorhapis suberifaciens]MBB4643019.1 RND family efflux transporter MFP subunit [Rhizorhapis suberifaciens]